jgi:DNA-directed RNA polymerase subunit beta'
MANQPMSDRNSVKSNINVVPTDFSGIKISVASPENILSWSYGEVTKPETINYRTQKPERDGLFDERIFGPVKDYECYCGKYKKIRYRGIVCDRCGVEVTRSSVRRERMGHIDLAVPVVHVWYLHGVPSVLSTVLDMPVSEIESVVYFANFVILDINEEIKKQALEQLSKEYHEIINHPDIKANPLASTRAEETFRANRSELDGLKKYQTISESRYHEISMKYGQIVTVGIGAEAILEILDAIDLDKSIIELEKEVEEISGPNRKKYIRRLRLFGDMKKAKIKPTWLVMSRLPVIPPDLRPMVQLDGGRFATSDLNDLYRRVLNRNNRLKRLIKHGAPEVICRNEKRMLQEAVDALIDNSTRRGRVATTGTQRKLRSLSDILRGKQGRFRQNLLGKRVDYSGRSVIVVGPKLKLYQCGLPKVMAIELFKTFVISRLINDGYVHNVKNASRIIEKREPIVWDILEQVTKEYHVLLNRAPTLHRLGIQAFQPVLIEGKAIQIHPSVCYAFNADFDGDQMAVHIPLSEQACAEAKNIMLSSKNLLKPASGEPVISPRLDIVMGCYYLTSIAQNAHGTNKIYSSKNDAIMSFQQGMLHLRAKIIVRLDDVVAKSDLQVKELPGSTKLVETSVGRILFNNILPDVIGYYNVPMNSSTLKKIIALVFKECGQAETARLVDSVNETGFKYATYSGITISMDDIYTPEDKPRIIKEADESVDEIEKQYRMGLITGEEKRLKTIELWLEVRDKIEKLMIDGFDKDSPVWLTVSSGARGSVTQLVQMSGMKGNVVNPAGKIIELPIKASFKEGLSVLEYFISTHGSRKGKSDTALRTSDAGYLTRRLVDVAQDIVVMPGDCGTKKGITMTKPVDETLLDNFSRRIIGRVVLKEIKSQGKTLVKKGHIIDELIAPKILKAADITSVELRSGIYCQGKVGVCQKCYGLDLATGSLVAPGSTVGIIAAQAIGEPGTQLTMKTFHLGGVTGVDITSGLPRVEELFEARSPRTPAVVAKIDGQLDIATVKNKKILKIISERKDEESITVPTGYTVVVATGDYVKPRQVVATTQGKKALRSAIEGLVNIDKNKVVITASNPQYKEYEVSSEINILANKGDQVKAGQALTEGHLDLEQSLLLRGSAATQEYIISEVKDIYASQGQEINDKHVELIVGQMFSKHRVLDEGDSELVPGQLIDYHALQNICAELAEKKKRLPVAEPMVLGITRVALKTESFLSAASFQETTNVLIEAATRGAVDKLHGLKENVIIGRPIPAGTSFDVKTVAKGK